MTSEIDEITKRSEPSVLALSAFSIAASILALWLILGKDDKTVKTTSAGTVVNATIGADGKKGIVESGTGEISGDAVTIIETTTGYYFVTGRHSLQKGEAVRIEQTSTGKRQLCTSTFCDDLT